MLFYRSRHVTSLKVNHSLSLSLIHSLPSRMTLFLFLLGCPEPIVYQQDSLQPPDNKHMVKIIDDAHRQGSFWIDAFEYPNIPNQRPLANASLIKQNKLAPTREKDCVRHKNGDVPVQGQTINDLGMVIHMNEIGVTPPAALTQGTQA